MVQQWRVHQRIQETQVQSLAQEDPVEKEVTTHSSTLAWKIPWTEETGGLQSLGLQRVIYNLVTKPEQREVKYLSKKWRLFDK